MSTARFLNQRRVCRSLAADLSEEALIAIHKTVLNKP